MAGAQSGVLLRGFDFETDELSIRKHCSSVGRVVSVEMKSKGTAVVVYNTDQAAQRAVEKLNQSTIPGNARYIDVISKTVQPKGSSSSAKAAVAKVFSPLAWKSPAGQTVKPAWKSPAGQTVKSSWKSPTGQTVKPNNRAPPNVDVGAGAKVVIHGWDFDTSESAVKNHCAKTGGARFILFELRGSCSAHLTYKSAAFAQEAANNLDNSVVAGNTRYISAKIKGRGAAAVATSVPGSAFQPTTVTTRKRPVASAQKSDVESDGATCFIRGMDADTSEDEILNYLSTVGDIKSSNFGKKNTSVLVTYSTKEEADFAVLTLNGTTVPGNERYIDVIIHDGNNTKNGNQNGKKRKTGGDKPQNGKGPSGPNLDRERLTAEPITGKVLSFKGVVGWIQPTEPFEHETAKKHKGKIYVHQQDVTGTLQKDDEVQFEVFVDASGLGAEEVLVV